MECGCVKDAPSSREYEIRSVLFVCEGFQRDRHLRQDIVADRITLITLVSKSLVLKAQRLYFLLANARDFARVDYGLCD